MFPQCYLSYMDHFQRAIPVMPGSYPSSVPGTFQVPMPMPMPSPGMFPGTTEGGTPETGDHIMGGGTMQMPGTTQGGVSTSPSSPFETLPGSPTILDTDYTQGYLRTQIGKTMRVTFLLGTNTVQDREGVLEKVGISFIILRETQTNNLTLGDMYAIKFVTIFP